MKGAAEVMVLARAELAAQRIVPCVRDSGHRLFAVVHSVDEAVQAMGEGPLQPERAKRVSPDVLLIGIEPAAPQTRDAVAELARALDIPVVLVGDDDEVSSCMQTVDPGRLTPIRSSFEPRELSLAIQLALCHRENARLRAWHGGVVSATLLEEDSHGVVEDSEFPSSRRWRHLLSSTPAVLYCAQDVDGFHITFMSENVSALLGFHTHHFASDPRFWMEHIHPDDVARVRAGLRGMARSQGCVDEYRFLHRDGSYRWLLDTRRLVFDEDTQTMEIVGSWMDITERKQAEEALRASEQRYRAIVEDQTELICRFLPDGTLTFVNGAYCRYFDKRPEELLGKSFMPLIPEEDQARAAQAFASLSASNPLVWCEHRVILPDGRIRWQSWTDRVIVNDAGEIIEYQSVGHDTTERKEAERALRASELRYRAIVEDQTELICRFLPDGTLTFVNGAYCRYFDKRPEELLGKSFMPLIPDEDQEIPQRAFQSLGRDTPMVMCEHRIILPSGELRWHNWTNRIIVDDAGEIIEYQAVGRDVTPRKQVEEALRESEARYMSIFQLAAVAIWENDVSRMLAAAEALRADGVTDLAAFFSADPIRSREIVEMSYLVNANDEALRLCGVRDIDELRASLPAIFVEESAPQLFDMMLALFEGKAHYEGEIVIRNMANERRTVLVRVAFPSREPRLEHMLLSCVDITERKRAEEQIGQLNADLRQRAAELEAANAELEAFSYSVSHDLRAPLRAIDGFSKAVIEDYAAQLGARGKGHLQRVRQASQRMSQLIDDLLELSRMTRRIMRVQPCDLSAVARDVLQELRRSHPDRQVAITIAPDMRVNADPNLLRIMMENLLGNAWKFTSKQPQGEITVGTTQRDGRTAYYVRDNGAGFEMAYVEKLFSAFQRLHAMNEFEGTGIGLATVKRIVRRHGGEIWAEGHVDQGATFTFTLP